MSKRWLVLLGLLGLLAAAWFAWPRDTTSALGPGDRAGETDANGVTPLHAEERTVLETTRAEAARAVATETPSDPSNASGVPVFPGIVRGVVRFDGGAGNVRGTRVRCSPSTGRVVDVTVDDEGRFEVVDLPPGGVKITAVLAGAHAPELGVLLRDEDPTVDVVIELRHKRTLRVHLLDGAGRPMRGADFGEETSNATLVGLDRLVPLGEAPTAADHSHAVLTIRSAPNEFTQDSDVPEPESLRWTMEVIDVHPLYAALTLEGFVVDSVAVGAAQDVYLRANMAVVRDRIGALVVHLEEELARRPLEALTVSILPVPAARERLRMAESDARGRVEFRALLAGTYRVEVGSPRGVKAKREVVVTVGAPTEARLAIDAERVISGTIEGRDARASRATLYLYPVEDEPTEAQRAAPDRVTVFEGVGPPVAPNRTRDVAMAADRFTFVGVLPGRYVLRIGPPGEGATHRIEVDVTHASRRDLVLKSVR